MICDKLFLNGKVYTVDEKNPWAQAVGVVGKKIVYVGDDAGAEAYKGPETEIIDLEGRLMLPGLIEAHAHPMHLIGAVCGVDITNCKTVEEYLATIKAYAEAHPERQIINGVGWMPDFFENGRPTKEALDSVVPDRPVCLLSADVFHYWVNSKMLELAGIDANTPDIEKGGAIWRDENGNPTGYLEEIGGQYLLQQRVDLFAPEEYEACMRYYQEMSNSLGITAIHDAAIENPEHTLNAFLSLAKKGELTVRLRKDMLARELPGTPRLDDALDILREEAKRDYGDLVQSRTIKMMMDGVVTTFNAALDEPYSNRPGYYGELLYDPEELKHFCQKVDADGFQLRIHAIGDRAIRIAIDAIAYAVDKNGKRDARHTLCHLNMINEEQMERMAKYNIIADINPGWHTAGIIAGAVPFIGEERARKYRRNHSFLEHGIVVDASTDAPVVAFVLDDQNALSPFVTIQVGMTRCDIGKDHTDMANVHAPEERCSLEEMIRAVTLDAAYSMFTDDVSGSIEVGKYADLAILDQNVFEIPVENIYKTKPIATYFEGKEVYHV